MTCPFCDIAFVHAKVLVNHLSTVRRDLFPPHSDYSGAPGVGVQYCPCGMPFVFLDTHLSSANCYTSEQIVQHLFDGIMGRPRR